MQGPAPQLLALAAPSHLLPQEHDGAASWQRLVQGSTTGGGNGTLLAMLSCFVGRESRISCSQVSEET